MLITPIKTSIFRENEDLMAFIEEHIQFCHSCEDSATSTEGQGQEGLSQSENDKRNLPYFDSKIHGNKEMEDFSLQSKGPSITGLLRSSQGQERPQVSQFTGNNILEDGDVLVITSKIVALAEGRTFIAKNPEEKLEHIKKEGVYLGKTRYVHLSIVGGMYTANAGIDESNADGKCIYLPEDSYRTTYEVWEYFREKYHLKHLGVIITDSRTMPLRKGTTGVSLGHAGFEGLHDYTREKDIFGRPFHFSRANIPDALATAAVHTMGEGDECQPLAIIKNPLVTYTDKRQTGEDMIIDPEDDMYKI